MSSSRQGNDEPDSQLESAAVAPTRFEFRLDDQLKAAAAKEAEELGIDLAEFVRQSMMFRLVWMTLVRSMQLGADPEGLADTQRLAEVLAEVSKRERP
jgi:antitoxin component of RelBE/YafQ-DinJ toxin-antitoxin module